MRKLWMWIKSSRIFNFFKHSDVNLYHRGVEKIVADTPQQEQAIAREKGLGQYIDKNGVRCYVNFNGTPQEEYEQTGKVLRKNGDVTDRIPRDKDGKLDLTAEEPIMVCIIPLEGVSLTGHACMQYKDRVINRVWTMNMEPLYPQYQHLSDYYFVYPSQIHVNPEKLIREMDKHNIRNIKKNYNFLTNNCDKSVSDVLKKCGVNDIDFLGYAEIGLTCPTPGNNPFHLGVEDWCMRHGVPVTQEEVSLLFKHHEISNLNKRVDKFTAINARNNQYKNYIINKQTNSKLSEVRNKVAKNTDSLLKTNFQHKTIPAWMKYVEQKISDTGLGKDR